MRPPHRPAPTTPREEIASALTHGVGTLAALAVAVSLVVLASLSREPWRIVTLSIFGSALVAVYAISTSYHVATRPRLKAILRKLDHAAIFILIAGSYTPFTMNVIGGRLGWAMFALVWTIAAVGVTLKLFFTGKYGLISTVAYVLMGWMGVIGLEALLTTLPTGAVVWLVAGGVAYTLGAVLYGLKMIKFNHAIFHLFVLLGSICHFVSVFLYVLPHHTGLAADMGTIVK